MKRVFISVIIILIGIVGYFLVSEYRPTWFPGQSGPSIETKGGEQPIIKIGVGNWIGFGPFFLAQDKGYFKEFGFDVQPLFLTGTGERNAALASRQIEGLAAPIDTFIFSRSQGVPLRLVLAVDESTGGDGIVATPSIKAVGDLAGKTVAFQKGMPGHFFLLYLLNEFNLSEKDIIPKNLDTAEAGTAFITGKVDAAVVWEPWLSKAAGEGKGHVIASTKEHRGVIVDCLAFNPDFVKGKPLAAKAIIAGWFKAVEYWKANPNDANAIMAKKYDMPAEKFAAILTGATFADEKRNRELFSRGSSGGQPSPIEDLVSKALAIWRKAGVVSGDFDQSDFVDSSLIPKN